MPDASISHYVGSWRADDGRTLVVCRTPAGAGVDATDASGAPFALNVLGLYDDFEDDFGAPWALPLVPFSRANES
jgi:hypothetical protein